jgi:pimeloyl-ACP methyl ester carboxylesterase
VRDLANYWREHYDFEAAESRMNAWPQFRTPVDDLDVHFLHVRSPESNALPLVMSHGWPGTFVEFLDVLGPLTDPVTHGGNASDAFHVVCPSLPGYGFSEKPARTGYGIPWIAEAWATLMDRLGYERYAAQGGDWGSAITCVLGESHPDRVVGIHITMPTIPLGPVTDDSTESERKNYDDFEWHSKWVPAPAVHPAPDTRVRPGRLARGPAGMGRREVLGLDRLRR